MHGGTQSQLAAVLSGVSTAGANLAAAVHAPASSVASARSCDTRVSREPDSSPRPTLPDALAVTIHGPASRSMKAGGCRCHRVRAGSGSAGIIVGGRRRCGFAPRPAHTIGFSSHHPPLSWKRADTRLAALTSC